MMYLLHKQSINFLSINLYYNPLFIRNIFSITLADCVVDIDFQVIPVSVISQVQFNYRQE